MLSLRELSTRTIARNHGMFHQEYRYLPSSALAIAAIEELQSLGIWQDSMLALFKKDHAAAYLLSRPTVKGQEQSKSEHASDAPSGTEGRPRGDGRQVTAERPREPPGRVATPVPIPTRPREEMDDIAGPASPD